LSSKPTHPYQPGLQGFQGAFYVANNSTGGSAIGGVSWAAPTAAVNAPMSATADILTSMRRNRYQNVITTLNQEVGIRANASTDLIAWRGNLAGMGGFYFAATFGLNAWSNTCRLFVGLTNNATGVVISDTVLNNTVGLWHDTTDGSNLVIVGRDGSTTNKSAAITSSAGTPSLAANKSFVFELYAPPNVNTISYQLRSLDDNKAWGGFCPAGPINSVFLGPQVMVSNAANTPAATVGIDIMSCYLNTSPVLPY